MMRIPRTNSIVMLLEEIMRIQVLVVLSMALKATRELLSKMKSDMKVLSRFTLKDLENPSKASCNPLSIVQVNMMLARIQKAKEI